MLGCLNFATPYFQFALDIEPLHLCPHGQNSDEIYKAATSSITSEMMLG
jgi:hypothetical protein